ncbi:MAG: sigma-70 family RNA polymerase sigma factor [Bacteroidaceae bacterium]|nr:sigma-70 family RNA polymerase sigma factor [Bacteroidaceae bacterium]
MTRQEFEHNYIYLGPRLYRMALAMLGNRQDAEDAVHDVFMRLWHRGDVPDAGDKMGRYITVALRNACIDRLKGKRETADSTELFCMADGSQDIEETLEQESERKAIREWIKENMPEKMARVLTLRMFAEMETAEIAALTGETEVNVRSLLSRGRRKLLEQYKIFKT